MITSSGLGRTPRADRSALAPVVCLLAAGTLMSGCGDDSRAATEPAETQTTSSSAAQSADIPKACDDGLSAAQAYGPVTGIVGGEESTVAQVTQWQEQRFSREGGPASPSRLATLELDPASVVTVCIYQGTFAGAPVPSGADSTVPDAIRLIFGVEGQAAILDTIGYVDTMAPDLPSDL